jgi:hypothetical protein
MRLTMDQRRAVSAKLAGKYRGCMSRKQQGRILDQVVELTGYNRHYAAWLLRNFGKRRVVRSPSGELVQLVVGRKNRRRATKRPRKYGEAVKEELAYIWDAFGLCGKKVRAMMRDIVPSLVVREDSERVKRRIRSCSRSALRRLTGFPMLPVLIGLFAISQILIELRNVGRALKRYNQKIMGVFPTWEEFKRLIRVIVPCSFLGTFIGIIPGTGGAIASFMAYNEARKFSKNPKSFGTGNLAGVAAPEAANNGTTGGAMVPLLTLGIPGDVVTSVMLGALLLIGIRPGPLLFKQNPQIINALFVGFMFAQFLILLLGLVSVRVFPRILRVPISILFPIILALCFLGSFSLNNSIYDMFIALLFGVIGYFMRKYGFAAAPMILGVILGPLAERELGKALIMSHGDWATLIKSPIAVFFYGISVLSVAYSILRTRRARRREEAETSSPNSGENK